MKAINLQPVGRYLKVDATSESGGESIVLTDCQISPRGVNVNCSAEKIALLHGTECGDDQPKFQSIWLNLELGFKGGETIQLETAAQVQSIRRISQQDFEVHMSFSNMITDGYRHIARYIGDSGNSSTE